MSTSTEERYLFELLMRCRMVLLYDRSNVVSTSGSTVLRTGNDFRGFRRALFWVQGRIKHNGGRSSLRDVSNL